MPESGQSHEIEKKKFVPRYPVPWLVSPEPEVLIGLYMLLRLLLTRSKIGQNFNLKAIHSIKKMV